MVPILLYHNGIKIFFIFYKVRHTFQYFYDNFVIEVIKMEYTLNLSQEIAEIYNLSAKQLNVSIETVLEEALVYYIGTCLKEKKPLN